jgi:tRNA dimethylallyltransferase
MPSFPPLVDRCWFVTGPTASGKSAVGVALAQQLGGEILSLDSMAVYRGMDLGTAKPTEAMRRQVPHHLIDLATPEEDFSVAAYLQAAHRTVAEVVQRGRVPIFVGGTPLYLKALVRGFDSGPPADWPFRRAVEEDLQRHGSEALWERLRQVDPLSAHRLHPRDTRRIIRALEVNHLTGQPLSHRQMQADPLATAEQCHVLALRWPRPILHQRIEARVDGMFAAGLVDEVRGLLQRYGQLGRTASQAVGYREVIEHLAGQHDLDETRRRVKEHTRQLARRQETWLRGLSEVTFVDPEETESGIGNPETGDGNPESGDGNPESGVI